MEMPNVHDLNLSQQQFAFALLHIIDFLTERLMLIITMVSKILQAAGL